MIISLLKEGFRCIKTRRVVSFKGILKAKSIRNINQYWLNHFLFIPMPAILKGKEKKKAFIRMKLQGSSMRENGRMSSPQGWGNR